MGMDVMGKAKIGPGYDYGDPDWTEKTHADVGGVLVETSADGTAYFRNNIWWWHRLADHCIWVAPEGLIGDPKSWHANDGAGLDEAGSLVLAEELTRTLDSGAVDDFEKIVKSHNTELEAHGDRYVYCFDRENVEEFRNFLLVCGGFEIW